MAYKRGDPLINVSSAFRFASFVVFFLIVWPIAMFVCVVLYGVRYEGRKKLLRFKERAVLVANHTTLLDPVMITGAVIPLTVYQTLLEVTVETPFLGTLTRLLGGVPLPKGMTGLEKLLEATNIAFRYRRFLHFYPEGECYLYNQQIMPYKFGAFYIAAKLNIPVIPIVTVFSEGRLKPKTFFARKFPHIKMIVLDPLHPAQFIRHTETGELDMNSVKEFAEEVRKYMQNEIDARRAKNPRCGTQAYFRGQMPRVKGINR